MVIKSREQRHERTRQSILNAAITLIAEKGADKLSLRGIARKINHSPAGLYEYFASKDEIINAVCTESNARLYAYLQAVPVDIPLHEYLVELGLAYIRFAQNNPEHFVFMFMNLTAEDGDQMETTHINRDDSFNILYSTIERGIADGKISKKPEQTVMDIAYGLWAIAHGSAMLQVKYLRDFDYDFAHADQFAIKTYVDALVKDTDTL